MIHYIFADALEDTPRLRDTMFTDRATQFRDRLKWEVSVDAEGHEHDEYDTEAPLYVIAANPDGTHAGSMRFLPTTGRTMVHEHFLSLTDGVKIQSPYIWECTRFCLAPGAPKNTAAMLMLGAAEMGLASGLSHSIGVFDARMILIYRRLGWSPAILGSSGEGREQISVGLWAFTQDVLPNLRAKAGVSPAVSQSWMAEQFGPRLVA
jgi:N-acyl-L-homoserine lactone synthetase